MTFELARKQAKTYGVKVSSVNPVLTVFALTRGVDGSSDDLDVPLAAVFRDADFRTRCSLGSLNSVNVARVLVQVFHYFYAYLRATDDDPVRLVRAAPLVRVKANISVKHAVCEESSVTAYGVFDRDFDFGSHEWSCSPSNSWKMDYEVFLPFYFPKMPQSAMVLREDTLTRRPASSQIPDQV